MTTSTLPISRLVNVAVNLAPNAAQMQNISTLMVLGTSLVIDLVEQYRTYNTLSDLAADFGTACEEYYSASLWFAQSSQPTTLMVGRWANSDSAGLLRCATLSTNNKDITTWQAVTAGSFAIGIDGTTRTITGLNFSAVTALTGVASIIQTALTSYGAPTVVYDSVYQRFTITSGITTLTSAISFLATASSGTDISNKLGGRATSSGAYQSPWLASKSAVSTVSSLDNRYGQAWYGLMIPSAVNADHISVAPFIEATTSKHLYFVTTIESGVLSTISTTDIAYLLQQLNLNRTIVQYSSNNPYAVASLAAKALTIDYNANNSVIDLMYKQEPSITAEALSGLQLNALEAKNANVFVAYNNSTAIIDQGNNSSGVPIDIITGTDWLSLDIQTAVYNLLYLSSTKIPQTDAGNHLITTTIESILSDAVNNGLLAPGTWTAGGFGALNTGDFIAKGFYVYAPSISTQNTADRSVRKSVTFQIAVKLAGAIRTVNVIINVNR